MKDLKEVVRTLEIKLITFLHSFKLLLAFFISIKRKMSWLLHLNVNNVFPYFSLYKISSERGREKNIYSMWKWHLLIPPSPPLVTDYSQFRFKCCVMLMASKIPFRHEAEVMLMSLSLNGWYRAVIYYTHTFPISPPT